MNLSNLTKAMFKIADPELAQFTLETDKSFNFDTQEVESTSKSVSSKVVSVKEIKEDNGKITREFILIAGDNIDFFDLVTFRGKTYKIAGIISKNDYIVKLKAYE